MIRRLILLIAFGFALSQAAHAGNVSLAWDPSESTNIAGYKVYYGQAAGVYGSPITIGNQTTYTVTGLTPGTYYLTVTAFDEQGNESDFATAADDPTKQYVVATLTGPMPAALTLSIATNTPAITWHAVTALGPWTATIAWQTNQECSGLVYFGTSEAQMATKVSNNQGTTDHLVNLTGLIARTRYVYQMESVCGSATLKSPVFVFNTKVQ